MEKPYSPSEKDKKVNKKESKSKQVAQKIEMEKPKQQVTEQQKVPVKQEIQQKDKAVVNGYSLRISPKNSKYICKMILKKDIEKAIELLEKVVLKKLAVKMDGAEIPHRKGKGMMSGRYPVNAAKEFIVLLKQLKANCVVNGIDNSIIKIAMSNKASLPFRREGKRGKRTHVYLEAVDKTKLKNKKQ